MILDRLETYAITENTYYLKSELNNNRNHTVILDEFGEHYCPKPITRVLHISCRLNGITLERMRAISKRYFSKSVHKQPLVLTYHHNLPVVFFSVYSPRNNNNIWINCNAIINILPTVIETSVNEPTVNATKVIFQNFKDITLPVQYTAFCGLYVRALFFQKYLRKELPSNTKPNVDSTYTN